MDRIRTLLSSVMTIALLSSSAYAADAPATASHAPVTLRASARDNSTRLVFEGATALSYTAQQTPTALILTFSKPLTITQEGAKPNSLPRIDAFIEKSPTSVEIDVAQGQTFRHFVMGKKIVVDITGKITAKPAAAPAPAPATTAQPDIPNIEPAAAPIADSPKDEPHAVPAPEPEQVPQAAAATPAPDVPQADSPLSLEQYIVNITSTSATPVAAFERSGYLWVVEGKENLAIPPQIEGDGAKKLEGFEPVSAHGATAFRMKLPPQTRIQGEGGGLVWKVKLAQDFKEEPSPTLLKREFPDPSQAGGMLVWPAHDDDMVVDVIDPDTGETLKVVLVNQAKFHAGESQDFVDVTMPTAAIGMAVVPKADDVTLTLADNRVEITRPTGLVLSKEKDIPLRVEDKTPDPIETKTGAKISRIFDFKSARLSKIAKLPEQQRVVLSGLREQTEAQRAENLIALGRMLLAHNFAPEALGYFDLAQQFLPDITANPELRAYRGAAEALSAQYKESFADLSVPVLEKVDEIQYWKAFALAGLDDWQQAAKTLPDDPALLESYPDEIKGVLGVVLAEIALREGNSAKAEKYLATLTNETTKLDAPRRAALEYLKGELSRQKGNADEAKEAWTDLEKSNDDLYRAKARFALTSLKYGAKEITIDKAIDNLEGLRYAWRGDSLETSINFNLAKLYLEKNDPIKALTLMKGAMMLAPNSDQGKMIAAVMHETFENVFKPENIKKISPVDAMTLYSEFADLTPVGAAGDAIARQLAERLVDADLLPRATAMLTEQVNAEGRLKGIEGADVALRLAALQLLDSKPDMALLSLDKADGFLKGLTAEEIAPKQRDIGILRAKSYSALGKPDAGYDALSLLPQDPDILKLRSEIAWRAKRWQDAADALEQLVMSENISLTRPLSEYQAELILNWAVSLYLADNRYVLANLRERYSDAMMQTAKAQKFEIITRPRQSSLVTDKDSINSIINEIEIFKGFADTLKAPADESAKGTAQIPQVPVSQGVPESLKSAPGITADEVLAD